MKFLGPFIVIIIGMSVVIFPQRRPSGKPRTPVKTTKTPTQQFSVVPFDPSTTSLLPAFNGHEIERVFESIKFPSKSEFESSEQYSKRVENFKTQQLFGQISASSILAFRFNNRGLALSTIETSYDADSKRMNITVSGNNYSLVAPHYKSNIELGVALELRNSMRNGGSFIGSNSYGVKRRVSVGLLQKYNLVFQNCPKETSLFGRPYRSSITTTRFGTSLTLDVLDAIDLKYNVALLMVGRIKPPFSEESTGLLGKATISRPTEIRTLDKNLFFGLDEIWIYSYRSGRVFTKLKKCTVSDPVLSDSNYFF